MLGETIVCRFVYKAETKYAKQKGLRVYALEIEDINRKSR